MVSEMLSKRPVQKRIRLGMVGGGQGAFIGEIHRIAARLDNRFELVAGALSSDNQRAHTSAEALGIDSKRSYSDFVDMARREAELKQGIEACVVVTPNHQHYRAAKAMLEAGIHVICDKPLTANLADAEALQQLADASGLVFAVTYNYSGYPMVREARELVASDALGELRLVQVEYPQDWLATNIEANGQKQAAWRTDPAQAGAGGSIGDIGSHAFHLAEFVSGLRCISLLADLKSFVPDRKLDDNAHVLLRFDNGARGMLWASQVATGHENGLRLRIYGEKAGLEWLQEEPNTLLLKPLGAPTQKITRGSAVLGSDARYATRLPAGHPEGFLEGFANLYREFADTLEARRDSMIPPVTLLPTVADGVRGVKFIEKVVASAKTGSIWQSLE